MWVRSLWERAAPHSTFLVILTCLVLVAWSPAAPGAAELSAVDQEKCSRPSAAGSPADKPVIGELVDKHADRLGVDPNLVYAVMRQESGFNSRAVSPKGAMGLMQLMPETAVSMGVRDPFDPEENIRGGIKYLRFCLDRFGGDLAKALAAYNAGPQAVEKYGGCPPFTETRDYIARVMQLYRGERPLRAATGAGGSTARARLSPAALAVLRELYPYHRMGHEPLVAEHARCPSAARSSKLTPAAQALLRELNPYRYPAVDDPSVRQPRKPGSVKGSDGRNGGLPG